MIKKLGIAALLGVFALGLVACGQRDNTPNQGNKNATMNTMKQKANDAKAKMGDAMENAGDKMKQAGENMQQSSGQDNTTNNSTNQ